jgi:multiple sugar transport system ATP-binding protein
MQDFPTNNKGGPVATITLNAIDKIYENGFQAVTNLSLDIDDGEFLVLVGPSGCGKSTALRMIAGLESISAGELRIGDRVVNDLEPKDRDIAMVFQSYALYPHLTVRDNIAFALKLQKVPKEEIERRVADAARTLELTENLDRKPAQLSGGQRQRVAMGRAIVRQPQAFLMDEPLSNLDAKLRVQMRGEIAKLQHELNTTTVYVTHDQIEAMTMGDRVAVMSKGSLMQVDSPQTLYDLPDNLFVAAFIGSPQMNLLRGMYQSNGSGGTVQLGSSTIALANPPAALAQYNGREVAVGIRPEHLTEALNGETQGNTLSGVVSVREGLGSEVIVHLEVDAHGVDTEDVRDALEGGTHGQTMSARLPPTTKLHVDDRATLNVNADQMHLFDLQTGLAIR